MLKNLILTGGMYHPFEESAATLSTVLETVGVASIITSDLDLGFDLLDTGDFDLLTVYALRWTMPQDKFAHDRAASAYTLGARQQAAMTRHLGLGKGLLALHTAAICFDNWPGWREIVGAGWTWGESYHPPLGSVGVRPTGQPHPIVGDAAPFELVDEAYTHMDIVPGLQPLLEVRSHTQTTYSPCLWTREVDGGRVVYDALGHDSTSFLHPVHQGIVQRAALWATQSLN
ncbi:ThuA domain-containing protein [Polaromonas sp. P1-6]|nr:ThuA domain-containing protein [Polaromonas sp. P1-6]